MWSYVGKKTNPRWLWHAIDRRTGQVLAYVFGRRKDEVFLQLKKLLQPFGIKRFCTDGWGAYQRYLPAQSHEVDKRKTQRIERKHLQLRTRIMRLVKKRFALRFYLLIYSSHYQGRRADGSDHTNHWG